MSVWVLVWFQWWCCRCNRVGIRAHVCCIAGGWCLCSLCVAFRCAGVACCCLMVVHSCGVWVRGGGWGCASSLLLVVGAGGGSLGSLLFLLGGLPPDRATVLTQFSSPFPPVPSVCCCRSLFSFLPFHPPVFLIPFPFVPLFLPILPLQISCCAASSCRSFLSLVVLLPLICPSLLFPCRPRYWSGFFFLSSPGLGNGCVIQPTGPTAEYIVCVLHRPRAAPPCLPQRTSLYLPGR